jgi:hypothetical protein
MVTLEHIFSTFASPVPLFQKHQLAARWSSRIDFKKHSHVTLSAERFYVTRTLLALIAHVPTLHACGERARGLIG